MYLYIHIRFIMRHGRNNKCYLFEANALRTVYCGAFKEVLGHAF